MTQRTSDEPLTNPEQDLLGLATHAETLAQLVRQVPTPFTIGIHGDWGAGKTTFVNFLQHYLRPGPVPVEFIAFDAWLYKTADELWRALILDIARKLYGVEKDNAPLAVPQRVQTTSWRDVLARDAIVFSEYGPPPTPDVEFRNLAAFLDQSMYGGIGKDGMSALRLDHEDTVMAAVTAGVTALGAVSPIIGGLRALLGLGGNGEGAHRVQREKNEATRDRIESIARFERLFAHVINEKGYGGKDTTRRLCIFVDNLDRCMPDVALDLLEAIKIFLKNAQFVFVVAADERLIGQGLEIRYKDRSGTDLANKGQEYIEKIVQLRIHIPEFTQESTHRFIAAQFPEWMPATDIIYRAVGCNPRRLKQYCNWLSFRYAVDRSEDADTQNNVALLDKLISLHWHNDECLKRLRVLARTARYEQRMNELEQHLLALGEDASDEAIAARTDREDLRVLCKQIASSHPLHSIVTSPKRFSEFSSTAVATLASIADLGPHPELMLEASDRVFMRILQQLSTGAALTEKMLLEDFARLHTLKALDANLFGHLKKLAIACADTAEWGREMAGVERAVQSGQLAPDARPEAVALHSSVCALSPASPEPAGAAAWLLQSPRLSEMLRTEVIAFCALRHKLPSVEELLDQQLYANASDTDKARRLAKHALDSMPKPTRQQLEDAYRLREWAAARCVQMRSFVKLNAVDRRWPALGRKLRTDFAAVRWLEKQALAEDEVVPRQYQTFWAHYKKDEDLLRFLTVRPLFGDIEPALLQKYLAVSRLIAPTPESAITASPRPVETAVEQQGPVPLAAEDYIDCHVAIAAVDGGTLADGRPTGYHVVLDLPGATSVTDRITFPWDAIDAAVQRLQQLSTFVPSASRTLRQTSGVAALSREWDFHAQLKEIGGKVYDAIIRDAVRTRFEELLASGRSYRFLLRLPPELMTLPVETIYAAHHRMFLALSQRYSLVRLIASPTPPRRPSLTIPLRVLAVLSNPLDTAPLNVEAEADMLQRAMASSIDAGRASLEVLRRDQATMGELQSRLRTFRPHVLHFVGHGVFQSTEGALVFHGASGGADLLAATHVATLLRDAGIRLAVLNSCDTGRSSRNDAITSVAGAVVHAGVPAVLATMREVPDEPALLFARDFYRTFCEGFPLETAIAEARKAISVERRDWSVYALFASVSQLDAIAIPHQANRAN
jgi:CHAT domain-containing protein